MSTKRWLMKCEEVTDALELIEGEESPPHLAELFKAYMERKNEFERLAFFSNIICLLTEIEIESDNRKVKQAAYLAKKEAAFKKIQKRREIEFARRQAFRKVYHAVAEAKHEETLLAAKLRKALEIAKRCVSSPGE